MAYNEEQKEEILNNIFKMIESGKSLRFALSQIPLSSSTFFIWIEEDVEKSKQYAYVTDIRTELKFESIEQDYNEEPQRDPESGRIDSAWVQLQRLKIDAKKWELSKLNPKKYGDKIHQELTGEVKTDTTYQIKIVKPLEDDDN
jgi:hypothetical protein